MKHTAGLATAAAITVVLAACGAGTSNSAPTAAATTVATGSSALAGTGSTKVNANTASVAQISAALQAAGVPSADRWAREVEEYRPYATDDPAFAKLKQNLAKYKPSADVVDKIVSTLTL